MSKFDLEGSSNNYDISGKNNLPVAHLQHFLQLPSCSDLEKSTRSYEQPDWLKTRSAESYDMLKGVSQALFRCAKETSLRVHCTKRLWRRPSPDSV